MFADYYTTTWYGPRKVTSVVSTVTQYKDTAITNYETKTTVKNATFTTTFEVAEDWVFASNAAAGPATATTRIDASTISINDRIVTSPAGFFVYPSAKVISVPAITQADGQLACTTRSTYFLNCSGIRAQSATFTGINTNVAAYFGGLEVATRTGTSTYTVPKYSYITHTVESPSPDTLYSPLLLTNQSTMIETGTKTTTMITTPTTEFRTTELSFSTPFLYFPARGKTEVTNLGDLPALVGYSTSTPDLARRAGPTPGSSRPYDPIIADYGYIPQVALDWIVKQYPSLASCYAGGPSILPIQDHLDDITILDDGCAAMAPVAQEAVDALTISSGTTVQGVGCFHPGNCPAKVTATPGPTSSTRLTLPESTTPASRALGATAIPALTSSTRVTLPESTTPASQALGEAIATTSKQQDSPTKSTNIPMPILASLSSTPAFDRSATRGYNPTKTAKPATDPGAKEVTAGSPSITSHSSFSLPAIIFVPPTHKLKPSGSSDIITAADQTITKLPSGSAVEILGQTLDSNSPLATVSGTVISLGSSDLVIGSSTVRLPASKKDTEAVQSTTGVGGLIIGAFGPHEPTTETATARNSLNGASPNATSPLAFRGAASRFNHGPAKAMVACFGILWHYI